jgi:glycosyltransferase involved in cell wall biosynthesis
MISIIIPTYDEAKYLIQTLDNIFAQTYQDFEIIIIDDGLSKEAREKNENYIVGKNKIKLLEQNHAGAPAARNKGVRESKGEFLFFCDDDILLKKDAFEKMVKALNEHLEASYVYCDFYLGFKIFKTFDFSVERLKKMPYISGVSLVRRKHFLGWDQSLIKFQDWDLWLTMLEKGFVGFHLNEVLFKAYPRKQGLSNWLPRFFYKIPWQVFPFKLFIPKAITKYQQGIKIIKEKHRLLN